MYDFSFLKGSIETIILNALYSGDKYGYEIAREIKEKTENKYEIKQPTLYGYLKRLEQNNLIISYWGGGDSNGGRRRYYKLTDSGRKVCLDYMSEWNFQRDIIDSLVAQADPMENLPEISQSEATSILGTKTKRNYRKREIVSETDLEELNKQISFLTEKPTQQEEEIQSLPKQSTTEQIETSQPIAPQTKQPETFEPQILPEIEKSSINESNLSDLTTPPISSQYYNHSLLFGSNTNNDSSQESTKIVEEEIEDTPTGPSINEQLKNMAPAGPQLIFAPTPPSQPIEEYKHEHKENILPTKIESHQNSANNGVHFVTNPVISDPIPVPPPKLTKKESSKESSEEKQYKQILGNLLEDQFDEMSKTKFDTPAKYDNAINKTTAFTSDSNTTSTPLKAVINDLQKDGIKASIHTNSTSKTYVPTPMIFTNKVKCYVACMLAFSAILELILMFFLFKAGIPDLKFTFFTILIIVACLPAIGFTVNYILNPTKKKEKRFNFKFNFINAWIFVGSLLAILSIIYFLIIGVGNTKELLLAYVLPFILSLNAPLGIVYHNLILKLS